MNYEIMQEINRGITIFIRQKDKAVSKITRLEVVNNIQAFEILTTTPYITASNPENMVFLYKKILNQSELEKFLNVNFLSKI